MAKHALTHLVDDHLAALDVVFGALQRHCKLFDLCLLFILEQLHLVLLLNQCVTILTHFLKLFLRQVQLLIPLRDSSCLLFLDLLDLCLDAFLSVTRRCFEVIKFFLGCFELLEVHLFHGCDLFFSPLDSLFEVVD